MLCRPKDVGVLRLSKFLCFHQAIIGILGCFGGIMQLNPFPVYTLLCHLWFVDFRVRYVFLFVLNYFTICEAVCPVMVGMRLEGRSFGAVLCYKVGALAMVFYVKFAS